MFGLLNIDKPAGLTSREVVNRVQRIVRPLKVGHAGTLDPLATGVLVVAIGQATRLVEYIQQMSKTYEATFLLGRTSDTEDIEGRVEEMSSPQAPTRDQIEAALPAFLGLIDQRPPAYSALKLAGRPAYKMARRGEQVDLAARKVEVHSIEIVRYAYPELELRVECGSGTYIRSLGRDLAESLGTGAVMSALRRLAVGRFCVAGATQLDDLSLVTIQERLLPATLAVSQLPQVVVDASETTRLARGQAIVNRFPVRGVAIAALDAAGRLVAILAPTGGSELRPEKCFEQGPSNDSRASGD